MLRSMNEPFYGTIPTMQIEWPQKDRAILSDKDLAGFTLKQAPVYEELGRPAPAPAVVR